MNTKDSILYFISNQLKTKIRIYDSGRRLTDTVTKRIDLNDGYYRDAGIERDILFFDCHNSPVIYCINGSITYSITLCRDEYFVVGPVHLINAPSFHYEKNVPAVLADCLIDLQPYAFSDYVQTILLLHNLHRESVLGTSAVISHNCILKELDSDIEKSVSSHLFHDREYSTKHNPYAQEQREMISIETGNLHQLKESREEQYSGTFGTTSLDPNRNGKNLAIIVIALATRAAIRGGVLPELAFTIGDAYMRQIEATHNLYNLSSITMNAETKLCQMVYDVNHNGSTAKRSDSLLVSQCKNYIFSNLHSRLTVSEISEHFYVHPNYLSSLFTRETGTSLYQYILNEKIALVKNLLTYSDYSYSEIASYLGFSSQSHLGTQFKKNTGLTLKAYRLKYKKDDTWTISS